MTGLEQQRQLERDLVPLQPALGTSLKISLAIFSALFQDREGPDQQEVLTSGMISALPLWMLPLALKRLLKYQSGKHAMNVMELVQPLEKDRLRAHIAGGPVIQDSSKVFSAFQKPAEGATEQGGLLPTPARHAGDRGEFRDIRL